jgi:tetratricopeptide (TPR) repeat protein/MinD-like ATPase involved in chromosome partitioning or flagellar assembly
MAQDDEHPQRVLVWDFDLEAPGIHRLFPPKQPQKYGFVDLVYEYATTGNIPQIEDYIYESDVPGVHVLPAGKVGSSYCNRLQEIDWVTFFGSEARDPGPLFGNLLKSIERLPNPFDYVLIDSRTGLNDQAGICTQVLSDLLIVLFRLTAQNLDGLEYLIPAIRSQFKGRGKKETQILPVASQVRAAGSEELALTRRKAQSIFGRELEYIRFDEDLVSQEKVFCLAEEIETRWPCPPVVEDYRRICTTIREQNKDDTRTQASELRVRIRERDFATASTLLVRLLPRRPRLHQAWKALSDLFDSRMPKTRQKEFEKAVSKILREDPENFFAYQWKAAFESSMADSTESAMLKKAKNALNKALGYAPESERGSILRALGSIDSVRGNLQAAVKFLRKAQGLLPENNQINLDLAMLHMRMGGKYFALAAEELGETPADIGTERYISLTYLRTYLGEGDKALDALNHVRGSMKPLAKAHMLLIEGKRDEAKALAEEHVSSSEVKLGLENWAEFYVCAEDFEKAVSLCGMGQKSPDDSKRQLDCIRRLAQLFQTKHPPSPGEMDKLLRAWNRSWNFRELLMFRECCIRDSKGYGAILDIIEKLIQLQELDEITSHNAGLFKRPSRLRRAHVGQIVFTT